MYLLFSCDELNALCKTLFSERLRAWYNSLSFIEKPEGVSNAIFFQQLYHQVLPVEFTAVHKPPCKATVSLWQRYWLNGFMMHWVWLLHKHGLHVVLSEQGTALSLSASGQMECFFVNLCYTPIKRVRTEKEILNAYRQLKLFLSPIFNKLTVFSRLNEAVFWHNCANLIEFALKELEKENIDISSIYTQLFLNKKWDEYEWSPFYNVVEYVNFPELPLPQPVRLRKVCCHAYLDEQYDYCGNCPKLRKISPSELATLVSKW